MRISLYIHQYFLIVPVAALDAANSVSAQLDNPGRVQDTFRRFPLPDEDGNYGADATHYVASFVATNLNKEGKPARQRLEQLLGSNPQLATLLWVRCRNEHHPSTPENERGIVVASNWAAFPVGGAVSWAAITEALTNA